MDGHRRTTMRDIARLRELAASGVSMLAAARETGVKYEGVRRMRRQFNLPFKVAQGHRRPGAHPALADLARARLAATMQRLHYARKQCT